MKKLAEMDLTIFGISDADSVYDRYMGNKSKKGDKTPQQKLDIEDDGMEPLGGEPMSMMDLLKGTGDLYEKEDEDHGDENDR